MQAFENTEMTPTEKGILQPKTFVYKWKIQRFFADCAEIGDFYTSPVFSIHCHDAVTMWYLKVYPKGCREECKGYTSLYLHFKSDNTSEVTVDYQISIVCKQNILPEAIKAKSFKGPNGSWGWGKFAEQDVVKDKKNDALIDDTLTILCEITFPQMAQNITELFHDYDELTNKIGKGFEDYEKLLENSYFSDVTFNIQDKKLHLHKAILMCRNSVFKAMFELEMKEKKESLVKITDIDYKVMKELFRFIYSGKVQNIEEIAKDLLVAADKYDVTQLKVLCEKALYHNLTVDNAIEYLKWTDMCDTIHLKTLVIKFVAAHYKEIVTKAEFATLNSINLMHQIMQAIAEQN